MYNTHRDFDACFYGKKSAHYTRVNTVLDKVTTTKVKLSGDGTNIGKRLKLENVTYTILNEKDAAVNEKGNYVLAIIKTTENYDNL